MPVAWAGGAEGGAAAGGAGVTNTFAIVFGLVIVAAIAIDLAFGLGGSLFLARRFVDLVRWVAFWR